MIACHRECEGTHDVSFEDSEPVLTRCTDCGDPGFDVPLNSVMRALGERREAEQSWAEDDRVHARIDATLE